MRNCCARWPRASAICSRLAIEAPVATVTIIGHRFDLACHDLRDFLARNRVLFRWHDPRDPEARVGWPPAPQPGETYPVVVLPDGSRLVTPTFRELAERLGLQTVPAQRVYDVTIIGAGPAGLAAAVYGASEGLCTMLIEREAPGGQAGTSSRIENYLGFPTGISGDELGARALQQATRFGVEIVVARDVDRHRAGPAATTLAVVLDGGDRVQTRIDHHRHRRRLARARGRRRRRVGRPRHLLRRGAHRGAQHARPRYVPDRRRQFGRAGGDVLRQLCAHASRCWCAARRWPRACRTI